jgi:hypothetical protein
VGGVEPSGPTVQAPGVGLLGALPVRQPDVRMAAAGEARALGYQSSHSEFTGIDRSGFKVVQGRLCKLANR